MQRTSEEGMAAARGVCGVCGRAVKEGDKFCPACGAPLGSEGAPAWVICEVCGFRNEAGSSYCASCGARLREASAAPAAPAVRKQRPAAARKGAGEARSARKKVEPWQIVSGIAVLFLLVFLLYNELADERSAVRGTAGTDVAAPGPPAMAPDLAPLRQAVASNPENHEAVLQLANALYDHGEWGEAAEKYKQYLQAHPENTNARVDLGTAYYQMGIADSANAQQLFAAAVREMEAAYASDPKHQSAAFNLGIVNLYRGDVEASNRWLQRTVEINSTSELGTRAQKLLEQHTFSQ